MPLIISLLCRFPCQTEFTKCCDHAAGMQHAGPRDTWPHTACIYCLVSL